MLRRHCSARPRAAIVAATRATRARPRPESGKRSTARSSSALRIAGERGWRVEPRRELRQHARARRASLSRGRPRARERADAGIVTTRSKRSRSAWESFARKRASCCGEHEHSAAGSARLRRGRDSSSRRAGSGPGRRAWPVSPRDADRAVLERLAEGLEHRPLELRELVEQQNAVVGEAGLSRAWSSPPPTIAAIDALWCGARKGGSSIKPVRSRTPATE